MIQRYAVDPEDLYDDHSLAEEYSTLIKVVKYDAHIAAVTEAEQRVRDEYRHAAQQSMTAGYERGQRDEREKWVDLARGDSRAYDLGVSDERLRIRKAVLGLVAWVVGPIRENGVVTRAVWLDKVLAVIDGEK
jgi:hypothetical protein